MHNGLYFVFTRNLYSMGGTSATYVFDTIRVFLGSSLGRSLPRPKKGSIYKAGWFSAKYSWLSALSMALAGSLIARLLQPD